MSERIRGWEIGDFIQLKDPQMQMHRANKAEVELEEMRILDPT